MTLPQFISQGETLARQAGVYDQFYGYFYTHAPRLHRCCELFRLFQPLGHVLEIGPFYGLTPFLLRPHSASYAVLEGDDPAAYPLQPLYAQHGITLSFVDFFELFGPTRSATHKLALPDASFDTILCWETMEHFNFNPVKFVRELHRVLKPGGRACVTVPNKASFQSLAALVAGRGEQSLIDNYFRYEEYESNGKKAFYGFHWREYAPPELARLFAGAGFKIQGAGSFTAFQQHEKTGLVRQLARGLSRAGSALLPRYGTHVFVNAVK